MDIEIVENGKIRKYCMPASHYIAKMIEKEQHKSYGFEVKLDGTAATIKKYSKTKYTDYYDKDHVYYTKSSVPPILIGGFYWDGNKDLAVFYKTCNDEENKKLQTENLLAIPYDVFRNLRDQDRIEIKGKDFDKTGKEKLIKFKALKSYIKEYGTCESRPEEMPLYLIPKDKFAKNIIEYSPQNNRKWKRKKGGG